MLSLITAILLVTPIPCGQVICPLDELYCRCVGRVLHAGWWDQPDYVWDGYGYSSSDAPAAFGTYPTEQPAPTPPEPPSEPPTPAEWP